MPDEAPIERDPPVEPAGPPLIVVLGPTAVGKTEVAIQLARRLNGEIVSADSRLFYRGMDIGTAKPTLQERAGVPHHMIDIASPDEIWSLAAFQETARRTIEEIHTRDRLPFLTGGTGQYVRAVIQGWEIPRVQPDVRLRSTLEAWALQIGPDGLHARLASLDPLAAAGIDYHNLRRTVRALEVIFTTGRRFSDQRITGPARYHLFQLGLTRPRAELYQRIDARIDGMLAAGLVDEVASLLEKGFSSDLPSMSAIGYRESAAYLHGKISLDEAVALMKRRTRTFVRRQANWFKLEDPAIHWFRVEHGVVDEIETVILEWLATFDKTKGGKNID